eukprot:gnl/TRDRNA2_/TRDRNA2_187903_c0_seq1.p1 gnl/TRDRNA2_/TRDRNA2_187903_c0~~gnl/TRDRNA2_/TRDRNA2_187903_c0_seq1.p1  ORF type:complete len:122 (+),score=5.52 gnl/TRDRNA2_/TRDRNA2_187903_c0_seq1:308-673(+)
MLGGTVQSDSDCNMLGGTVQSDCKHAPRCNYARYNCNTSAGRTKNAKKAFTYRSCESRKQDGPPRKGGHALSHPDLTKDIPSVLKVRILTVHASFQAAPSRRRGVKRRALSRRKSFTNFLS